MKNQKRKKIKACKLQLCLNPFSRLFGIKVKKYMGAAEIEAACKRCNEEYFRLPTDGEDSRFDLFQNVQMAFDVVVVVTCTDLDVNGETYDSLVESGIMEEIRRKVKNYNSAWNMILESLKLKNTYSGLNLIARMIPNPEAMDRNLNEISKVINGLREKDPDSFKKLIGAYAESSAITLAREKAKKE